MTLYEVGESILAALVQQAEVNGVKLPDRQMVYLTQIPADCEQVAVLLAGWSLADDPGEVMNCLNSSWLANISVIITRCTPAISKNRNPVPPTAAMGSAAEIASTDAELFRDLVIGLDGFRSPSIVVSAPVGGLQTAELNVSILGT